MNRLVFVFNKKPKFELGQLVVTAGIDREMNKNPLFDRFVRISLEKYMQCDWGDTCDEDKKVADESLKNGERILAVYEREDIDKKIWIITEWDRSITTILFPDEY